jgi:hypothetical protein
MYSSLFDFSRPEHRAALQMAERARIEGFTPQQVAEIVLTTNSSLTYNQLVDWRRSDDPNLGQGAQVLLRVVSSGFHAPSQRWWYLPALFPTPESQAEAHYHLARFFGALDRLHQTGKSVPLAFRVMGQLLFGRDQLPIVTELAAIGPEAFTTVFEAALKHHDTAQ